MRHLWEQLKPDETCRHILATSVFGFLLLLATSPVWGLYVPGGRAFAEICYGLFR